MNPEYGEQTARICQEKRRNEFWKAVAAANGARVPARQGDISCPSECPGSIRKKLLGIALPEFMDECPMNTGTAGPPTDTGRTS